MKAAKLEERWQKAASEAKRSSNEEAKSA